MIPKKGIDKIAYLRFLGELYSLTALDYNHVSLAKICAKYRDLKHRIPETRMALQSTGVLLTKGRAHSKKYKWNLKDFGPPSLLAVDALIHESRRLRAKYEANYQKRRKSSTSEDEKN